MAEFRGPRQNGVDIYDSDGNKVGHVDYGVNGITGDGVQEVYGYTDKDGKMQFTSNIVDATNISFDNKTGKVTINMSDKWADDDVIKSITDNYVLTGLSKNYKNDNNIQYQDPYDETRKINTEEYIDLMSEALKNRMSILEAMAPTKANLISFFGGSKKRNEIINNMTAEDMIIMSTDGSKYDDALMSVPNWMLIAYPEIKKLGSFTKGGYVKKDDFKNNFYNIEKGTMTDANADAITKTVRRMLTEDVEDMTPEEYAKTVAFYNFLAENDPIRSGWDQFWSAGDSMSKQFFSNFYNSWYDFAASGLDMLVNLANFSFIHGNDIDFYEGMMAENSFGDSLAKLADEQYEINSRINFNARAAQEFSGISTNILAAANQTVAIMCLLQAGSTAVQNKIISSGASKTFADTVAGAKAVSGAKGVATAGQTAAATKAAEAAFAKGMAKASSSKMMQHFFELSVGTLRYKFETASAATSAILNGMSTAQSVKVLNSAIAIANSAKWANTAVSALSMITIAAVMNNRELTMKVLSSEATSEEAALWLRQTMFDAGKIAAVSALTNVGGTIIGKAYHGSKLETAVNNMKQAASQKVTRFGKTASTPWLKFRDWWIGRKMANGENISNATATAHEAVREAKLLNEARGNLAAQSTVAPNQMSDTAANMGNPPVLASAQTVKAVGGLFGKTTEEIAKMGVVVNGSTNTITPFQEGQAALVDLENQLTDWQDIDTNVSIVIHSITNPDIEPAMSKQISEATKADAKLLRLEKEAGLLDKATIKANKRLGKEDYNAVYSAHSQEASVYAVRSWELNIIGLRANAAGITDLKNYQPYQDAVERLKSASDKLPMEIKNVIDNEVIPSLKKIEHSFSSRMTYDWHVFPEDVLNGLRAGGNWGKDGQDWLRLVARRELPKGTYTPYSKLVQRDNTLALNRFKVLDDDDITWIGNGLSELIREAAIANAERGFLKSAIKATGVTPEVVVSGEKTAAARTIKEYRTELNKDIKQSLEDFAEKADEAEGIRKQSDIQKDLVKDEINTIGGISTMDITDLRAVMDNKGVVTTDSVVDQDSFNNLYKKSTPKAKDLLKKTFAPDPGELDRVGSVEVDFNKIDAVENSSIVLEKVDRINAISKKKVTSSKEVKASISEYAKAQEELKKNIAVKDEYVYLASDEAKTPMQKFVDDNDLKLPDDKRSLKSKVKHALWEKVKNNDKLPKIKGIKKDDLAKIKDKVINFTLTDKGKLKEVKSEFYKMLDGSELFMNPSGPNPLKYAIEEDKLIASIDAAIDNMVSFMRIHEKTFLAIDGIAKLHGYEMNNTSFEFIVLENVLSKEGSKLFGDKIYDVSKAIVDKHVPSDAKVLKGNIDDLYGKVNKLIRSQMESRFAAAKTALESAGYKVDSKTVTELLDKYNEEITGAKASSVVVKTTNDKGEIEFIKVSPSIADIYNNRPIYTPMSTPMQLLATSALLKRISLTNLNPRSFSKQLASDTAMSFTTIGSVPGTFNILGDEAEVRFGREIVEYFKEHNPYRYENIVEIARRDNIPIEEAAIKNSEAIGDTQLPFNTMNQEALRQANVNKYGTTQSIEQREKSWIRKINSGLRKASDKLGKPNDIREKYSRRVAGQKAYVSALEKGYNPEQAEMFRRQAIDNATTNFRQKHTVFNNLRVTTPYLTSGISGAKSFWKMFELDPVSVTSRIFTGFVLPVMYFMGEIVSDEELRRKYESLAEFEKNDHIIMAINGELVSIPVGEEIGKLTNMINHMIETMYGENQYNFWNLMLNDLVGLLPGADLTGFTDPEMWDSISGNAPSFLEVMENGVAGILSSTQPPIAQSLLMATTNRDLYTGKRIDTGKVSIDADGNAYIQSYSQSQFSKALANIVGGDAKVIEKVTSALFGTTILHTLDTITSGVQYMSSGGNEGSLSTAFEKAAEDLAKPYALTGYGGLEKRFNDEVKKLQEKKRNIEHGDPTKNEYMEYNKKISKESNPEKRQKLINQRNGLLSEYNKAVEDVIKGYLNRGGSLDKYQFSLVTGLLTFEDALRADRTFMHLNTEYRDAEAQALRTLYEMGVSNPEDPSMLGYIYTDDDGHEQLKMWTPAQMKVINDMFYEQGDIHSARIKAIIEDGTENSLKNQRKTETAAEQPYWDKYNSTGKLSNAEWDAIDDLRSAYNQKVVLALKDYIDAYGANYILSDDAVINYLEGIIKVPSEYEKVNGRYVSSGGGKLDKNRGFIRSYLKTIFGVKKK